MPAHLHLIRAMLASLLFPVAMFACAVSHATVQSPVCGLSDSLGRDATDYASLFTQMSLYSIAAISYFIVGVDSCNKPARPHSG